MNLTAKRILVMRYRFIGDTVLTVPFLRNLREAFPVARIDLMLEPFSGQVIEGCPYVDQVIPFEFKTIHKYSARTDRGKISAYLHYRRMIRRAGYDAVFVLKRSLSSALLVSAAGVPRRIGFATEGRSLFLTDPIPYRNDQHEVENFLDCLRGVGIPIGSKHLELWTNEAIDGKVEQLLSQNGWNGDVLKVVIHAAASLTAKEWPLDRFAEVMRKLRDSHGAHFVYTGSKDDSFRYEEIERLGPFDGLNLCGITSVRENIAVYRSCDLFFGVDSGPMHMAAAAGLPVVALFGPTDERKWGPWGDDHMVISKRLDCHPCKPHKCDEHECMSRIGVPEVLSALEKKIETIVPKKRGQRS